MGVSRSKNLAMRGWCTVTDPGGGTCKDGKHCQQVNKPLSKDSQWVELEARICLSSAWRGGRGNGHCKRKE
jgi:hypothetical protein